MSEYSQRIRSLARRLADLLNKGSRVCKGIGYGFGTQPQHLNRAAVALLASWGLEELGEGARGVANDPADWDYDHETVRRRARIREEAYELVAEDELASAILALASAGDEADAALKAHLRAFERWQGASRREDPQAATERADEATENAREASRLLGAVSRSSRAFVAALERDTESPPQPPVRGPRRPRDLPEPVLAALYLSGMPIGALRSALKGSYSRTVELSTFTELADASDQFSAELLVWQPRTEPEG